jgi:uncharacterized protein (DUF736 family)
MAQIGQFTRLRGLFSGRVRTLALDAHLVLCPNNAGSDTANAPNYSVRLNDADGPEVGAGWKRTSERAGEYVAVMLDDPSFAAPFRANLFQQEHDKKVWVMVWNRSAKREDATT